MKDTFGNQLLQFANSVDILEAENFEKIQQYIEEYLSKVLRIKYVRLMLMSETMGGHIMLSKYVLNRNIQDPLLIRKQNGEYNGQMAYAFEKNIRLWITANKDSKTLNNAKEYVDHWSGESKLPKYEKFQKDEEVKTSIIIPIRRSNEVDESKYILGVVNFESQEHLPMTTQAQKELKYISYALGKLFQLHEGRKFQRTNTLSVITEYGHKLAYLEEKYKEYFFEKRPKVFFAFSKRADGAVVDSIKNHIKSQHSENIKLLSWDDKKIVGSITPQLLDSMSNAEYLVCYLSEKEKDHYIDNFNVLIELGYFMGKQEEYEHFKNILIIRESNSLQPVPFDIKDIFSLEVTRSKKKSKFKEKKFEKRLREKIEALLSSREEKL